MFASAFSAAWLSPNRSWGLTRECWETELETGSPKLAATRLGLPPLGLAWGRSTATYDGRYYADGIPLLHGYVKPRMASWCVPWKGVRVHRSGETGSDCSWKECHMSPMPLGMLRAQIVPRWMRWWTVIK